MGKMAYLYSKANYPVTVKYNGQDLVIPPNANKLLIEDYTKLGSLPGTIKKVIIQGGI